MSSKKNNNKCFKTMDFILIVVAVLGWPLAFKPIDKLVNKLLKK